MATNNQKSRGLRNNNPGNIRINSDKFQGEIQPSRDKSFKQFETMAYGYRAMFVILRNYYLNYSLKTIRQMITRWAPPEENNTEKYIETVSRLSGIPDNEELNINSEKQMTAVVAAMSMVENGVPAEMPDIQQGWKKLCG